MTAPENQPPPAAQARPRRLRYSGLRLLYEGLRGQRGWPRAWAKATPRRGYRVVIVGGGGHGLATAYYLATEYGITDVAVLEQGPIGLGNVGRNTTLIRSNYFQPDNIRFYDYSLRLWEGIERELNFNAMVSLGGTLMRLEPPQYELALPHLNRALELFRDNSFALYYRALANFKTGRLKEARQDFDILNSKTPDVFQYKLALAYIADTNRISKDAIKYYQEYLKTAPTTYLQERSNVVVRLKELKRRS